MNFLSSKNTFGRSANYRESRRLPDPAHLCEEHVLSLASERIKMKKLADYMEHNNILVIKEAQKNLDKLIESGTAKGCS